MVFGFLRGNKKENTKDKLFVEDSETFWKKGLSFSKFAEIDENGTLGNLEDRLDFRIPYEDIQRKFDDESYLKNIVKNDDDLHHRSAAVYLLWLYHNKENCNNFDFFDKLVYDENIFRDGRDAVVVAKDFNELCKVQNDANFVLQL